ncbi:MAG: methyltransferase domain-containing protein [Gemmobacter sp.]
MSRTRRLTDPEALARNRARAARAPALFLHEAVADEIEERLAEVNKTFTAPAIVTPFPDLWEGRLPGATIMPEAETLPLAPGAHDLVIHALALHWADDPVGQIIQCRRALRPDGLFMAAMFGGRTLAELRAVLAEAEAALTGGLSPRVLPMAEIRDLGGLLQRAGLALPVADGSARAVTYRDAFHLMHDLRAMGEGNALAARHRRPPPRALFAEAARRYAEAFPAPQGRIRASFETIFLTGWAPHESQQQPLRPGSAAARLADVLGAEERPLPADKPATTRGD